jgi:hypothetical protein
VFLAYSTEEANMVKAITQITESALDQRSMLAWACGYKVVAARLFCPEGLLPHYGTLSATAPAPYVLTDAFNTLAAAQAAFPKSASAGDLTSATFATNSLEWAVWNEAMRYCESTTSLRTVLIDEGAYGVAGTLNPHTGIMFVGPGSMGSSNVTGVGVTHFSSGDFIYWDGSSEFEGTGGGIRFISIWKANRLAYGGLSYGGGTAIRATAQGPDFRPGEILIEDVLVASEAGPAPSTTTVWAASTVYAPGAYQTPGNGYYYECTTGGQSGTSEPAWGTVVGGTTTDNRAVWKCSGGVALWQHGLDADGSTTTTPGGAGVRSIHILKLRIAGCYANSQSAHLNYVEHFNAHGLQIDTGNSPSGTAGMTIEGDSSNIEIHGLVLDTTLILQAAGTAGGQPEIAIASVSAANPATVTTNQPLPFGTAGEAANVNILGCTPASFNGSYEATITGANTFTIPIDGSGYQGGGTVQSTAPRDVTITGRAAEVVCYAPDCTGTIMVSNGVVPGITPRQVIHINCSPNLRIAGPNKPLFELANIDYTYSGGGSGVTGDGTPYTCLWNTLTFDYNADFVGQAFPGSGQAGTVSGFECWCAGKYHFTARVALTGTTASNTLAAIQLYVSQTDGSERTYSLQQPLADAAITGIIVLGIDQNVVLNEGDIVQVRVVVSGNTTANVSVFADAGSGFTVFDGALI